jgi:uncharacterized membrane protein YgdD (TMEM256/DUF423 family)
MSRPLLVLAALNGLLAIAFGAFGAHALSDPQAQDWLETATRFQLPHAAALLALAALWPERRVARWLLGLGALLFAGALQALALGAPRGVAMLAPVGGGLMIAGWAVLLLGALRR